MQTASADKPVIVYHEQIAYNRGKKKGKAIPVTGCGAP
jgi:hypothetical protein